MYVAHFLLPYSGLRGAKSKPDKLLCDTRFPSGDTECSCCGCAEDEMLCARHSEQCALCSARSEREAGGVEGREWMREVG